LVFNKRQAVSLSKWLHMAIITVGTFLSVVVAIVWNGLHKKDIHSKHNDWFSEW